MTLPDDPGALRQAPAPIVRREFDLPDGIVKARLYVTSLGLHEVLINGRAVSDALLSPGWTTYHHRLLAETHDVTALLVPGLNAIAATLGDGWYRGRLGWDPGDDRCHYGDQLGLIAQLEVDLADGSRHTVVTDESWVAATGEIQSADLYDGCVIDYRQRQLGFALAGLRSRWLAPCERGALRPIGHRAARGTSRSGGGHTPRPADLAGRRETAP